MTLAEKLRNNFDIIKEHLHCGWINRDELINKIEQKTDYERTVKLEPKLIERKSVRKKNKILRKEKNDL